MPHIIITAAALTSAAETLTNHSEREAPDDCKYDIDCLIELLEKATMQVGGSVPTEMRLTVEQHGVNPD